MENEIDYPAEYDNSARVENSKELIDNYIMDAAVFREMPELIADLDQSYGPKVRNMMDVFWPNDEEGRAKKSKIVMFIHGGYWQRLDRTAFSHMASGLNARGLAVAIPSYTLCPDIKIDGIINEMRRACLVLFQTYRQKLTVIGHSAGGHLAACMMATDWPSIHPELPADLVTSGMGISGLYDLIPITKTPVNDAVGMDEQQAHAASPIHWMPEALQRFEAWVGGDESNEYHRQSKDLASYWSMCGSPTKYISVPGANHFTVINELLAAESAMVDAVVALVKEPSGGSEIPEPSEEEISEFLKAEAKATDAELSKAKKKTKANQKKKSAKKGNSGPKINAPVQVTSKSKQQNRKPSAQKPESKALTKKQPKKNNKSD